MTFLCALTGLFLFGMVATLAAAILCTSAVVCWFVVRCVMPVLVLMVLALTVSGCTNATKWKADCANASFNTAQCSFLYDHRAKALSISGPFNQSLVGINLP